MQGENKTQWATDHVVPLRWMRQFLYFSRLFDRVKGLPGDVVECGVGQGNTLSMLACLIGSEARFPCRRLWGFDSFEGFPEPSEFDVSPRNPQKGEWKIGEEAVESLLKESGITGSYPALEIHTVKGMLGETLPSYNGEIAFLHLDVDLYEGYRDGLQHLYPKLVPGGVIAFDEYKEMKSKPPYSGQEKWPGCTRAVNEYFSDKGDTLEYYPETGKYFLIKKG